MLLSHGYSLSSSLYPCITKNTGLKYDSSIFLQLVITMVVYLYIKHAYSKILLNRVNNIIHSSHSGFSEIIKKNDVNIFWFSGSRKVLICGIMQYSLLWGTMIGFTITTATSIA